MAKASKAATKAAPSKAATKQAAPKKAAAKKAASEYGSEQDRESASKQRNPSETNVPQGQPQEAKKKSGYQPKDGETVEFDVVSTRTGVYKDGKVIVDGQAIEAGQVSQIRQSSTGGLDDATVVNQLHEVAKQDTFAAIGIPENHQGENLHEQNPHLAADLSRTRGIQAAEKISQASMNTISGSEAEDVLRRNFPN